MFSKAPSMKNAKVGAITRDKLDVWNMVSDLLCEDELNRAAPPPRMIISRAVTAASIQTGS